MYRKIIQIIFVLGIGVVFHLGGNNAFAQERFIQDTSSVEEVRVSTVESTPIKGASIRSSRDHEIVPNIFPTGGIKIPPKLVPILDPVFVHSDIPLEPCKKSTIKKCANIVPVLTTMMSSGDPSGQTIPAGKTNVKIAEYDFIAQDSFGNGAPLQICDLEFKVNQYPTSVSIITNLKLRVDGIQVGSTIAYPVINSNTIFQNTFGRPPTPLSLSFAAGETKKVSVYADIPDTVPVGTYGTLTLDSVERWSHSLPNNPCEYSLYAAINTNLAIRSSTFTIGEAAITPPSTAPTELLVLGGGNDVVSYSSFNDVFKSTNLQQWNTLAAPTTSSMMWSGRRSFEALYFNAKYWVFGGGTPTTPRLTDIWNSSDGVVWNKVSSSLPFANHYRYKSIVFDNKIYVIGGRSDYAGGTVQAKAWSTIDGIHWTTTVLPFFERENPTLGVFNDELYVIGGVQGVLSSGCTLPVGYSTTTGLPCSYAQSDIWKTTNGITWSKVGNTSLLGSTSDAKILTYNNKLYFMGGVAWGGVSGGSSRKIYTSTDGVNWVYLNTNFPSSTSLFQEIDAVVVNGKMVVGDSRNVLPFGNKLWTSTDGFVWVQQSSSLPWSPRTGYRMIAN